MNPTPYSLSSLHVISTATSQLLSQFSWLPVYYILSSWLLLYLIIFLSIILILLTLPPTDDTLEWPQHNNPTPSHTCLLSPNILGNIAYEFIWIPGYYLHSSWPWIFYFLFIFNLPWFIPCPYPRTLWTSKTLTPTPPIPINHA